MKYFRKENSKLFEIEFKTFQSFDKSDAFEELETFNKWLTKLEIFVNFRNTKTFKFFERFGKWFKIMSN